ncbi:hypothetical protein ALI144C_19110 [Actinosynnema sp. ALI-1.44]|uniref:ImmA/IrrE family metallo-endopeptidase n=1 Tax=Actinosynnema sp. ALI-1.44 TaxID=1933779 RepID=UPI00097C9FD4|nr:ImmA/IrrE family metallo-endopeptidase [Actinosynnema sp. ALI-1.44]ONI81446.1 hypothetical protein ALI144C_19110 [Actinosynnema sp. ALI-1.44]
MELARLRARCEEQIRRLRIQAPLDVAEVCRELAEQRNRPIHLLPLSSRPSNPSGLWVSAKSADYIFYEESAGTAHREHIILHELGHLLFGHSGVAQLDDLTARLLAPNLDPSVVRKLLCRGKYDDELEQEAELFATLVLVRTDYQVVRTAAPEVDDPHGVLAKLKAVLGGDEIG